ncbi:STAS domain-containing protein [Bosea lathyri]|uniref:STAS domain-containing protein n=1 Tax=Bosea lathyri TaxID=1036778 RepID=A0A1H6CPI8_9HYPH|nr:STAS domain-containing protein [Bosea lathyri]SEG74881.1 STAS domain-containing protein [Bosea lathyri]
MTIETFILPVDCSLRSIRPLHAEMAAAFQAEGDLTLDCSALATCDLTVAQLLVSATRTAATTGRTLRLAAVPAALATVLARAGLALSPAADRLLISEV